MKQITPLEISADVKELRHLRSAFERLEGLGPSNSPTIDSLKFVVLNRIVELEGAIDESLSAQAIHLYEANLSHTFL